MAQITAASFTSEAFANLQPRKPREARDPTLPVLAARDEILEAVRTHATVLIAGETGSGKSTQIPQFLLDAKICTPKDGKRLCVTQPRRVAVLTVSERVAAERGGDLGGEVGYAMRFERVVSKRTSAVFATDGLIVREMLGDTELKRYGCVIVDEAHERSVHTDVLLGLCKRTQQKRPLKLILMSATLDVASFQNYFEDCAVVKVPGRLHDVDVFYCAEAVDDYHEACITCCAQLHADPTCEGDILVFMPGQEEIAACQALLEERLAGVLVVPLYAALSKEKQLEAFAPAPPGKRKFIISTTIAETSVTVSGVRHVIDPGWAKNRGCDSRGFEALRVEATSKAQARQRAGRAGREAPGRCYRLYPETAWTSLPDATPPEILRCDLAGVVLSLKALGVARPETFDFVTKPPRHALLRALETLYACDALDAKGALTALGRRLASLPLPPLLASAVDLASTTFKDGAPDVLWVVAAVVASEHGLFVQPRNGEARDDAIRARDAFEDRSGDLWTSRNALRAAAVEKNRLHWCRKRFLSVSAVDSALRVRKQLLDVLDKGVFAPARTIPLDTARTAALDCVAKALCVQNAAVRDPVKRCFRALRNDAEVAVHPGSVLHGRNPPPEALVFASSVHTTKLFLRGVTAVDAATLARLAPRLFSAAAP